MKLGTSKVNITPKTPLRLAGYANRFEKYQSVIDDIYVVVYSIDDSLFIYGDLLWWGSDFVKEAKDVIESKFNIRNENIIFVASHNHSGPGTSRNFTQLLEEVDSVYINNLLNNTLLAIEQAIHDKEDVSLELGSFHLDVNVYRRKMIDGNIEMVPNYDIEVDKRVRLMKFKTGNEVKGLMVHYPCHANVANVNDLNGDYPRILLNYIDEKYGINSMFLQGHTGDIRPNVVIGEKFLNGKYEHAKIFAEQFFHHIVENFDKDFHLIEGKVFCETTMVDLKLNVRNSLNELKENLKNMDLAKRQWAEAILNKNNRDYETLEISKIQIGDLTILGYNAEVSQEYSLYAERVSGKTVLSLGYTNGMIGYVTTKKQIENGGYEPDGSTTYFALSGPLKLETEEVIKNVINTIMEVN